VLSGVFLVRSLSRSTLWHTIKEDTMSATTDQVTVCACCSASGEKLNDDDQCVDCELRILEADSWAAQAVTDILGAAAKAATLHLSGEDVRRVVSEAVADAERERDRAGLVSLKPIAEIDARLHLRRGERLAKREAVSA
jgi:hypothetical protein